MTLETIKNIVSEFYHGDLIAEDFADLYYDAQLKIFSVRWRDKNMTALRHYLETMGDGTPPLLVTEGTAILPSDYFHQRYAYYMHNNVPRYIEFINDGELARRLTHAYEYPTAEYPVAVIGGTTITFKPSTVRHVVFHYLKFPEQTVYAVDYSKGMAEFDESGSSPVLWDTPEIIDIIGIILQSLNIQANNSEIQNKLKQQ